MTESASNLTIKLVMQHDELKHVNHVVIRGALLEVVGSQIQFQWFWLKKFVHLPLNDRGWGIMPPPPDFKTSIFQKSSPLTFQENS